ncbi:MAG: hypothetical protein M0R70_12815 [Nitrospirae bacterium]|nr:hypothetical protein [Nitrospirota bacterium]
MNGRDKRRRLKERQVRGTLNNGIRGQAPLVVRSQTPNPAGVQVQQKASEPVHGKYCRVRKAKVDITVCTVQSTRTPDLCKGCE